MAILKHGDMISVHQHIVDGQRRRQTATGQFSSILSAITFSTKIIASYVRRAGLIDVWGDTDEGDLVNVQGETVQKLDRISNDMLMRTLGYRDNVDDVMGFMAK